MKRFLLLLLCVATLRATTYNSDGSPGSVQALINSAVGGDTITIPAGSFTWPWGVSIAGKYLTIQGAGNGRVEGSSTSSVLIGTGSKSFTIAAGTIVSTGFNVGETVTAHYKARAADYMVGTVTSWDGTTLVLNVSSVGGSGTFAAWTFSTNGVTEIIHNAGATALFSIVPTSIGATKITGLDFSTSTGNGGKMIDIAYNATPAGVLLYNLKFNNLHGLRMINLGTVGGVVGWNLYMNTGFNYATAPNNNVPGYGIAFKTSSSNSWTTASTMGTADTTGLNNSYFEQCYFAGLTGETFDFDDNARGVVRYSVFDNSAGVSHGADTSSFGNRHFEIYGNKFIFNDLSTDTANINQWFFIRGGTGVITNNVMPDINSTMWGNKSEITVILEQLGRQAGPNGGWGVINTSGRSGGWDYPAPRQPGMGYVTGTATLPAWVSGGPYPGPGATWSGNLVTFGGSTYKSTVANTSTSNPSVNTGQWTNTGYASGRDSVTYIGDSEPIWIWDIGTAATLGKTDYGPNNTNSVSTTAVPITCDTTANYFQISRDYFFDNTGSPSSGAKPGYTPYTYPHPLHSGFVAAPVITTNPLSQTVPTGANATFVAVASGSPTWQWSKDGSPIVGATNSTFSIIGVAGGDAGTYAATATNSAGSATTTGAVLTVVSAPSPATGVPATPVITGIAP